MAALRGESGEVTEGQEDMEARREAWSRIPPHENP